MRRKRHLMLEFNASTCALQAGIFLTVKITIFLSHHSYTSYVLQSITNKIIWQGILRYYNTLQSTWTKKPALGALVMGGGGTPLLSHISMCRPKGCGFCTFPVWKWVYILPILVWNHVWLSRELHQCINMFVVSIPNE